MIDLMKTDISDILKIVLLHDHDDIRNDIKQNWHGHVEDVCVNKRTSSHIEAYFSMSSVASDENECFPMGEVEANSTLSPGDSDAFCSGMVVTFDDLDPNYKIIITGTHSCGINNDESYDGYFNGSIHIIHSDLFEEELIKAIKENEKQELEHLGSTLQSAIMVLYRHSGKEIMESPVWGKIQEMNRYIVST